MLIMLPLAVIACDNKKENEIILTMTVASERMTIEEYGQVFDMFIVKIGSSNTWQTLWPIIDFDYEEGYEYVIKVRKVKQNTEMQDAAPYYYLLPANAVKNREAI